LFENPVNRQKTKHTDERYHFIRSEINHGIVVVEYCSTIDMVADMMAKPATKAKLEKFQ